MATLASEFLRVHPATALWWQQRDQCQRCAHLRTTVEGKKERTVVMRCYRSHNPKGGRQWLSYCIDARAEGRACGPDAKLFKEL